MKFQKIMLLLILGVKAINVSAYAAQCDSTICEGLKLPSSTQRFITAGYSNIEISKLKNNKYLYLSSESDINKCSVIFNINENKIESTPVVGQDGKLCNISEINGSIVSSRRDQGVWYNDVYQISSGKSWDLQFTDSCADCQQVKRIYYKNGVKSHNELMSEGNDYTERKPLIGIVSVQKASLYSTHDEQKKSKAYLIKGDSFSLTDMSDDGVFYQINYKSTSGKSSLFWIKSDDFDLK